MSDYHETFEGDQDPTAYFVKPDRKKLANKRLEMAQHVLGSEYRAGTYEYALAQEVVALSAELKQVQELIEDLSDAVIIHQRDKEQAERERDEWEEHYNDLLDACGGVWPG